MEFVEIKDKQAVTSSLQVADTFDKQHKDVIEAIENKIQSAENSADYQSMFSQGTYRDRRNRKQKMYYMNRDGFTFIAFGFTGKKADKFKLKYIDAFNEMEHSLQTGGFKIPTTMSEALRLAADQSETIEKQQLQLAEQAPKALFADSVAASHTTILVGLLAKILRQNGVDIGQNRLFKWLRANGYLISRQGSDFNSPTQRSMDLGLFEIKESTHIDSNGVTITKKTSKVTGKGQQYFINKFLQMA